MASFNSNVAIRIAADFVGLPAFKKADTAVDKLYKSTKKLAGAFGVAFSATAIARYGATAVRAFAAEERQIAALTATVKSLGIEFTALQANDFIENLERTTGIVREELQPAFQRLLTQTGSLAKSQQILNTAVAVSMSGLMSVGDAANALTQAYVGNVRGLRQFNLGLTNAELQAMSFDQILQKVSATYDNQFNAALDTTQVKINKFNVAVGNATENIGSGLVDAFGKLAGGGNLDAANKKLETFSLHLADIFRNFNLLTELGKLAAGPLTMLASTLNRAAKPTNVTGSVGSPAQWRKQSAALAKAEAAAAAKTAKAESSKLSSLRKQTAEKRAQAAIDKANKVLTEGKGMFDLEGIQLAAALQGKLTEEQRSRVETLQKIWELEQAIQAGNTALIEKLTSQLQLLIKQTEELNTQSQALLLIKNILGSLDYNKSLFDLNNITSAMALLNQMSGLSYKPSDLVNVPNLPQIYDIMIRDLPNAAAEDVVDMMPEININITENARKLIDVIYDTVTEQSASGNPPIVTRVGTSLAW